MKYNRLAKEINANARAKGFWDEERNFGEMLMLAISELSEAREQHRSGNPYLWFFHAEDCLHAPLNQILDLWPEREGCICNVKPEGIAVEIADCAIRLMDTLYSIEPDIDNLVEAYVDDYGYDKMPENFGHALAGICRNIANGLGKMRSFRQMCLTVALDQCVYLMKRYTEDPEKIIRLKMDYNATRPHKHGKAY
jgi:hypothetical protein